MIWYEDPVYIKMCEQAKEIQGDKSWERGSFVCKYGKYNLRNIGVIHYKDCSLNFITDLLWNSGGSDAYFNYESGHSEHTEKLKGDWVWLPRQDELQILSGLLWKDFDMECLKYDMETKEQAGICVVMKCKFQKQWQDDAWIKI